MMGSEAILLESEARLRAIAIGDVSYRLNLEIDETATTFKGRNIITFSLSSINKDLFLDLKDGAEISQLVINGNQQSNHRFHAHRISLPSETLQIGQNIVEIDYRQPYANTSRGLFRFKDSEDQWSYLYTQFEEYDAHQMFPCFDQPDIKAKFTLEVIAPKDWEIISTTRETLRTPSLSHPGLTWWRFPETPKLSTYLFSLHAGPFTSWNSIAGNTPLRLFARQSFAKFVRPEYWFSATRQGLDFYENQLGQPYPFTKYDQVIVPDFSEKAMENAAAITFTEQLVRHGTEINADRAIIENIVLHEMAHQWFGNLVTMTWWNGTWLKESFATYEATLAGTVIGKYKNSWLAFFSRQKVRAYREDQLSTTHAIDYPVADTAIGTANFDGITYGKGAAVLKQLVFYIGEQAFQTGVRRYLKKYAYQNASLDDFIETIGNASNRDLRNWANSWLRKAGVDTLEPSYTCEDGLVKTFTLFATGPAGSNKPQRVHRTKVALFAIKANAGSSLRNLRMTDVTYGSSSTSIPTLRGVPCPDFVEVNYDDQDYVKVRLDKKSLQFVKAHLETIQPPLLRLMVWQNLFQMVLDHELAAKEYLETVSANFAREDNLNAAQEIMQSLPRAIYFLPLNSEIRASEILKIEHVLREKIAQTALSSDWKFRCLESFIQVAESSDGRDFLISLLNEKSSSSQVKFDQGLRWQIIGSLMSLGDARAPALLDLEKQSDHSERCTEMAAAAIAASPDLSVKEEWITKTLDDPSMSFSTKRSILNAVFPRRQDDFRLRFSDLFFTRLPKSLQMDEKYLELFVTGAVPTTCSALSNQALANFASNYELTFPPKVRKALHMGIDEDRICIANRQHFSN